MINAPSSSMIKLYVDDEPLLLSAADLLEYERSIDFREGILRRDLIWRTPAGKRVRVRSTRMVSFTDRHLVLMTFEVTMLEGSAPIAISSQIVNKEDYDELSGQRTSVNYDDPRRNRRLDHRVLHSQLYWNSQRRMILGYQLANSGMTVAVGADHSIRTSNDYEELDDTKPDQGRKIYRINAEEGGDPDHQAVAYHTSQGAGAGGSDRVRHPGPVRENSSDYYGEQWQWLADFWRRSDVEIGAAPVQQAIRWCIRQLAQAAARADGMGCRPGPDRDGCGKHYFWV